MTKKNGRVFQTKNILAHQYLGILILDTLI